MSYYVPSYDTEAIYPWWELGGKPYSARLYQDSVSYKGDALKECLKGIDAVAEVHREHDAPATFFIVARLAESAGTDLRTMLDNSLFDIQCHSYTHANLTELTDDKEALEREIVDPKHLLEDTFGREVIGFTTAHKRLSEITCADVLDLRWRLLAKCSPATVNKALGTVKVIFREVLYREELPRDPTAGVGRIKYRREERGIFTVEELRALFPEHRCGPWRGVQDYTCFYLAAVTGLRRGELLVLRWRHIDFARSFLTESEAWKGGGEIGPPKWEHNRLVPLSPRTISKLSQLQVRSIGLDPDDFVFCYDNGARFGETWWRRQFCSAMERAGIDRQVRCLTPHSFRHTINTIVRDSGHDPAKIRAVLGWIDEAVQDTYTHWDLDHLKWADIVDEIWQV